MKILTARIPKEGLKVDFFVKKEEFIASLSKEDELRDYVSDKMSATCELAHMKGQVFIQGNVKVPLKPVCYRCNREYDEVFSTDIKMTCVPDRRKKELRGEDYMDGDLGLNYYDGEEIDLAKIAREQILYSLPMTYLCREGCKGLCTGCGADLNSESCRCKKPAKG